MSDLQQADPGPDPRTCPTTPSRESLFKDITPLLADPVAFAAVTDELAGLYQVTRSSASRPGFILAAPVAYKAGAGFVPVRKKGKLPFRALEASYDLEYGSATIEVHRRRVRARRPGSDRRRRAGHRRHGGAAVDWSAGRAAEVVGLAVLMELAFLKGRERLDGVELRSLVIV